MNDRSLTIYGIVASRAIRPLWAAEELGLSYTHEAVSYLNGGARTPAMLALNPNGHVPILKDDRPEGQVIVWESMACALYLARVHGRADGHDISPANALEEAEALRWSFWSVTEIEKDALTVLMHRLAMPTEQRKPELADAAENRLAMPFAVLEQHLAACQARGWLWLAADRFTVADVCTCSVAAWALPAKELMAAFPLTLQWIQRCQARPAHVALRARGKAGS
jgi:glutathione S-transferase